MAKRRKKRQRNRFSFLLSITLLIASGFLIYGGVKEVITTIELRQAIREVSAQTEELKEKKKELKEEKKNLSDPDYIEYIARGKYLVTKEDEQVFKFPSSESEDESE